MQATWRVVVVALALATFSPAMSAGEKKVRPGEGHASPTKLFQVTAPRSCASFSLPYAVQEGSRNGSEFFEEVVFYAKDTGEVYHVGVRRLTRDLRQRVKQETGPLTHPQLAWLGLLLHLGPREAATGAWTPLGPGEEVQTRHGAGVLSANHVEGGRLLTEMTYEAGKLVARPSRPALIVVLVIQRGEHLLYTTGQADFSKTQPDEETPECLQERLRKMMEDLQIARPLPVS